MEPIAFLDGISGYMRTSTQNSADKPIKIAVIDPAYDPFDPPYPTGIPLPRVTFEGETTLSGKTYPVAASFIPRGGQRVYMVPIGTTYLIAGGVENSGAQGFYDGDGVTGMEFGGGSYFDTVAGLNLETDADIAGDLYVGGVGNFLHKRRGSDGPSVVSSTTLVTDTVLFLDLDVGSWLIDFYGSYTTVGGDIAVNWLFTGTWSGLKHCFGVSPFAAATTTVTDANSRDAAPARNSTHQLNTTVPYGGNDAANYAALHETASVTVTAAGRWSIQYAQRVSNASQALMRNPSFMTARKVG